MILCGLPDTSLISRIANVDDLIIKRAARILNSGGLVAFPTETVYGLGADATNDRAVAKIFEAKERPHFNPLIVHVTDIWTAQRFAYFDDRAAYIAKAFWPGPLTIVLPRREDCKLSRLVSAGMDTVALRIPSNTFAQTLLSRAECPIAAPSANRSGEISPTQADHVANSLPEPHHGGPELILDGGPCDVGLESTVVDLSEPVPYLLRPGSITHETLSGLLSDLIIADHISDKPKSPGMMQRHYAPKTPLKINSTSALSEEATLGFGDTIKTATLNLSPSADLTEAAGNLFSMLRHLDDGQFLAINVAPIPNEGLGRAINDRLRRAANNT